MDRQTELYNWADTVVRLWTAQGLALNEGATADTIAATEKQLSFIFPPSFKVLYTTVNGWTNWAWNEHMFSLWPLDKIMEEYACGRHTGFIGFCDFMINSHWIGFVRDKPGIFKRYDMEGHSDPVKIADSFEEAIEMLHTNPDALY